MKVDYEFQPQSHGYEGEVILALVDNQKVGQTGYIPGNPYGYLNNNAVMKVVGPFPIDIEVDQSMRGKSIGSGLLNKLLERVEEKNYDTLIIPRPGPAKEWYSRTLRALYEIGKINQVYHNHNLKLGPVIIARLPKK